MHHIRLFLLFAKISILNELQYRANFFTQIFQSILSLMLAFGGLLIVFSHTDSLNGWTSADLMAIVGVFFLIGGVIQTIIQPGMQRLMEDIRLGTLDYAIIKPIETQFYVSVREFKIWKLTDVITGAVVLGAGLIRLEAQVRPVDVLSFSVMLTCGVLIVYSFWLMLASISFWFIKIENILVIFQSMYEAGRWPVRIYPGWLQFVLTFLVPIAFAVTVPVEAITGRLEASTMALAITLSLVMVFISHQVWKIGLRSYSGASA